MVLRATVTGSDDGPSVASHVETCLHSFQTTIDELPKISTENRNKIPPGSLNNELGRFRIWAANTDAHARGNNSLDYKLREASHLRDEIIQLLQHLETVLQEIFDIITCKRVPDEDLSDSESDDSMYSPFNEEERETTELFQLISSTPEIMTCLMRLSMSARNPAPHNQFTQSNRITMDHFEAFDVCHVRKKFPNAEEFLVLRLGKAITRRRQYLRYRKKSRRRLDEDSIAELSRGNVDTTQSLEDSNLSATSNVSASNDDESSPTGSYMTEYYEDILFQTSYLSSPSRATKLSPPTAPVESCDSEPFECPLCFRIVTISNDVEWDDHVFRDIQPYVCTFAECNTPDQTYELRDSWFEHELQFHRIQWECTAGCNVTFRSSDGFRDHFRTIHADLNRPTGTRDLLKFGKRIHIMNEEVICKLCQAKLPSLMDLQHHLGDHQCQLSLFALPTSVEHKGLLEENAGIENVLHGVREASAEDDRPAASHGYHHGTRDIQDVLPLTFERSPMETREQVAVDAEETQKAHDAALAEAKAVAVEHEKAKIAAQQELAQLKLLIFKPIKFRDAIGRKFSFPWNMCKTWSGMEELIKQIFPHDDIYGHHVRKKHYDLLSSDGDTILPQIWESMVEPGCSITMLMYWPVPKTPPPAGPQTVNPFSPPIEPRWPQPPRAPPEFPSSSRPAPRGRPAPPRRPTAPRPSSPRSRSPSPPPPPPPSSFANNPYKNMKTPAHPPDSQSIVAFRPQREKSEGKKKIPSYSGSESDLSLLSEERSKPENGLLRWIWGERRSSVSSDSAASAA